MSDIEISFEGYTVKRKRDACLLQISHFFELAVVCSLNVCIQCYDTAVICNAVMLCVQRTVMRGASVSVILN